MGGEAAPEASRLRVLSFAFSCSPEHGSEAAAAWGVANALAEIADVTVLVHPRHTEYLRRWQEDHKDFRLRFVEVPEVPWGLRIQERLGPSFTRLVIWRARYLGWLGNAKRVALQLHAEEPFDVAIHSAQGIYWLPAPVVDLGIPSVWGPVSGAPTSPRRLRRYLGARGAVMEQLEALTARTISLWPATRRTWNRATVRLVDSESTYRRLPRRLRQHTTILNRSVLARIPDLPALPRQSYLVFTSPLETRKGPRLAVHALAHTPPGVRLVFLNEGPEQGPLRQLAEQLGVADRVEFRGKVPRDEMFAWVAAAAGAIYTGLAEEGGAALAEVMLSGTPAIVLNQGGTREITRAATDSSRIALIEPGGADDTARRMGAAMTAFSTSPPSARGSYLDQATTRRRLQQLVTDAANSFPQTGPAAAA